MRDGLTSPIKTRIATVSQRITWNAQIALPTAWFAYVFQKCYAKSFNSSPFVQVHHVGLAQFVFPESNDDAWLHKLESSFQYLHIWNITDSQEGAWAVCIKCTHLSSERGRNTWRDGTELETCGNRVCRNDATGRTSAFDVIVRLWLSLPRLSNPYGKFFYLKRAYHFFAASARRAPIFLLRQVTMTSMSVAESEA